METDNLEDLTDSTVVEGSDNVLVYHQHFFHEVGDDYNGFGTYKISILDGEQSVEIAERDDSVRALVFHKGTMYDAGSYGVYETLTGDEIAERDSDVWELVTQDGVLLDGGVYGFYETLTGERFSLDPTIIGKTFPSMFLVSHKGTTYEGGMHGVHETLTGEMIAKRDDKGVHSVWSLVSHNGELLDSGAYGLYETLTGEKISDYKILSMASVPRSVFEEVGLLEQRVSD